MHMRCTFKVLAAWLPRLALAGALAGGLAGPAGADTDRLVVAAPRYDQEYPAIDYSGPATHNRVWRMQQKLDRGELKLQWEPRFGYLRSLLQALEIDPDSQVMVFSRTSLQVDRISGTNPRAIYFNDDTYVGWIHGSNLIEFTVIDAHAGVVFFGLDNSPPAGTAGPRMEREGGRCLTCHDTYSMMGGGVPRVLAMSSPVIDPADTRTYTSASDVDDRTPVAQRWGGWYVTGQSGAQKHFGNLALRDDPTSAHLRGMANHDVRSLAAYFDTNAYLTDQSDIVALLVLEHQAFVQNLITRASYKVRSVLAREGAGSTAPRAWADLDAREQQQVRVIVEPLVRALFLADAAPFGDRINGASGYAARFSALGPKDAQGRGLRQLDLDGRLFRHPLSFLVYSEHFNALPRPALEFIGMRINEVLDGSDGSGIAGRIPDADRVAIRQILAATAPADAPWMRATSR